MGAALKFFCAILIASLLGEGMGACSIQSLKLTQNMINVIGKKYEYVVTVSNECNCRQGNIKVNCKGFQTAKSIDPFLFKHDGADRNKCVLLNGNALGRGQTTYFKYVSDRPYPFTVVDAKMTC